MVSIKIHRGTSQIGGTITEIYTENTHIFIDFGSELSVSPEDSTDEKMIAMMKTAKCDAVLFSHYHGDHVGLLEHIPDKDVRETGIKLGMGPTARQVLVNIHKTLANNDLSEQEERDYHQRVLDKLQDNAKWQEFEDAGSFRIGDFHITTLRVDHSAYDSYMFVIEAEGKCIVHTGDFRVHGRLGKNFFDKLQKFMKNKKADVLLIEGTMLGRLGEVVMTEEQLQQEAKKLLQQPENKYVYLICSSTNMESLASFHNAVLDSNTWWQQQGEEKNRAMYINFYVKEQLNLFASAEPQITRSFVKAYPFEKYKKYNKKLQMSQIEYMEKYGFLCMIGTSEGYKKYIEPFKDKNPLLIYSMWEGYVSDVHKEHNDPKMKALYESFPKNRRRILHTSGHAVKEDLEKMIAIVDAQQAIIPIHTEFKESYEMLKGVGSKIKCLSDGEEYLVSGGNFMGKLSANEIIMKLSQEYGDKGVIIMGPSGREGKLLRVYANGGDIGKIANDPENPDLNHEIHTKKDYLNNHLFEESDRSTLSNLIAKVSGKKKISCDVGKILCDSAYLDCMLKATFHKGHKYCKEYNYQPVKRERLIETTLIAQQKKIENKNNNILIYDMEYAITDLPTRRREDDGKIIAKTATPDFIVFDGKNIGIVELKYNSESMGKNSLKNHFLDFMDYIWGVDNHDGYRKKIENEDKYKWEILEESIYRLKMLKEVGLIHETWNNGIKDLSDWYDDNKEGTFITDRLWIGFYFVEGPKKRDLGQKKYVEKQIQTQLGEVMKEARDKGHNTKVLYGYWENDEDLQLVFDKEIVVDQAGNISFKEL